MVKILRILSLTLLTMYIWGCKQDKLYGDVPETQSPVLTPHSDSINENVPGYYSALPVRYHLSNEQKRFPVIICIQGAGGFGNGTVEELFRVLAGVMDVVQKPNTFPPSFMVHGDVFSFILLAPQFIQYPSNAEIKGFIEFAKSSYKIDTSRIYLVGLSIGGRMACDYAAQYPYDLAAVVAMGGCADDNLDVKCKSISDAQLPVWSFHNKDDEAWPVSSQINFINTIQKFSPIIAPRMTIFENGEGEKNHNSWRKATDPEYKEDGLNIYEWMLSFKR